MSTYTFDSQTFINALQGTPLAPYAHALATAVNARGHALKHGHLPGWAAAVDQLPPTAPCPFSIVEGAVCIDYACEEDGRRTLQKALEGLMPWRKGPFSFGPVFIDTEWRSDWKWDRLASHLSPLGGRTVLDVGCGSGYHLWRIRNAGADTVLGIDPSLLYVKQFEATQHFIQDARVQLLPLPMEALPTTMKSFDTVFSMGVLYHRRDPDQHLRELAMTMSNHGELVLETLVIPGETDDSLTIDNRYANMRNIYELPTVARLCRWIEHAGFESHRVVDVTTTSRREQRATQWMTSYSLEQALDPKNPSMTVEGYPRPLRAVVIAQLSANAAVRK